MTNSNEAQKQLDHFQQDFTKKFGYPFKHFHCPILQVDEKVDLCLGHIVNEQIPGSSRSQVIQRADVDNWYGAFFEADSVAFHKAKPSRISEILADKTLIKKLNPKISIDGEAVPHHIFNGSVSPQHTPLKLQLGDDAPVKMVLRIPSHQVDDSLTKNWQIEIGGDFRLCNVVSMIKSAYLTLFQMLGYSYSSTAAGWEVGYNLLGKFYLENRGRSPSDVKKSAKSFFRPYLAMVRPMFIIAGIPPKGTSEEGAAMVAFGSSGRPFGLVVLVRTGETFNAVLMPAFLHPDSVAAYVDFLNNDHETLRLTNCRFDRQRGEWDVAPDSFEIHWPKSDCSFRID